MGGVAKGLSRSLDKVGRAGFYNASVPVRQISPGEDTISDRTSSPELAVIVINYDSGDHLRNCISNLPAAAEGVDAQYIVVDNSSSDSSLDGIDELSPATTVIRNVQNRGYGRACNQGFATTTSPFVCFLNPDIVPEPGSLALMQEMLDRRPEAGILGPRLNNPDGTCYPSGRSVPTFRVALGHAVFGLFTDNNRYTRAYKMLDVDHGVERDVDWVSGAAMMVRREAFEEVGGFDEGFFMYVEDLDLCARLKEAGWKAVYFPKAQMLHHVAGSSRRKPYKMIRHHHFSLIRFTARRLHGPAKLALPVVVAALLVRMLVAWAEFFFRNGSKRISSSDVHGPG